LVKYSWNAEIVQKDIIICIYVNEIFNFEQFNGSKSELIDKFDTKN